jgi:tetratricopeptide (TPR) repeat protein
MTRPRVGPAFRLVGGVVVAALAWAAPVAAQSTGMVKGKVVDGNNQVVEGAKVVIEFKEGMSRKFEVKTNKKGEFLQIGLQPGNWTVTATKEGVGTAIQDVRIAIGSSEQVDLRLAAGGAGAGVSKEEAAKAAAFKKLFEEGVAASQSGNSDVAITKFTEALQAQPSCYACQFNLGVALANKKEFDKAEAAFLAAAKLNATAADPYNQLANLYNAQKKYDKASEAAAEAAKRAPAGAAGGGADALFNQGVVFWNAGKYAEAKAQFDAAIKANPNYAEAYYRAGMAALNLGKTDEAVTAFEGYLKVAPTGPFAKEAQGAVDALKKK